MGAPLTFHGRLPGVVCEAALPPLREDPLRLDIAAFVGFAERGPLDLPVALEDISQYHDVFGEDLLLARTRLGGQAVYAALPQAVKAFFDNGGRRCYVVRVADNDKARPNRFRMPGLVAWNPWDKDGEKDEDGNTLRTVIAPAAWVGRWSDNMSVGTQLLSRPLHLAEHPFDLIDELQRLEVHLELPTATTVQAKDLLRLQFDGPGNPILFCPVESAEKTGPTMTTSQGVPVTVKVKLDKVLAFTRNMRDGEALPQPDLIEHLTETGWQPLMWSIMPQDARLEQNKEYILHLWVPENIEVGDLLRVTCMKGEVLLFPVVDVIQQQVDTGTSPPSETSPPSGQAQDLPLLEAISREALWLSPQLLSSAMMETSPPTMNMYGNLVEVDLLSFDLYIREGQETQETWGDVRFGAVPDEDYWINKLVPSPEDLQSSISQGKITQQNMPGLDPNRSSRLGALIISSETDGANIPQPLFLPLGMGDLPGPDEFAKALPDTVAVIDPGRSFPSKDGLEVFNPEALFLDGDLANVGVRDLINEANQLLYLNPRAKVAYLRKLHSLLMIDEVGLISIPDLVQRPWSPPEPADQSPPPKVEEPPPPPDWSHFQDCMLPSADQEKKASFGEPLPLSSSTEELALPDIREQLNKLPVLDEPESYDMTDLLSVQHALVNLCAARADVLAVLNLPLHFKRREVLEWQRRFTAIPDFSDGSTLSYAAVYHPWLQIREEVTPELAPLRGMPPDGPVCGMIAARERARGPWIAPANLPLLGVVGLTPTFNTAEWADLFNAQVNIVRQLPGQFTLMSAHTLGFDDTLLQISVRRLLIFLRKLALRRGMRYVFEANNERFRQRVQASFEQTLATMAIRGALTAFEVVTSSEINTPNDYDNGRFLIALKVAPTIPIEFITVVLLRAGEGLLEVIER